MLETGFSKQLLMFHKDNSVAGWLVRTKEGSLRLGLAALDYLAVIVFGRCKALDAANFWRKQLVGCIVVYLPHGESNWAVLTYIR